MAATLTNYFGNLVLTNYLRNTNNYLALLLANPTTSGSFANEVVGGGYVRKQVTWTVPSSKSAGNSAAIIFFNMPAVTGISYAAVCDAVSGGNMWAYVPIGPYNVLAGGSLTVPVNDLTFTLV